MYTNTEEIKWLCPQCGKEQRTEIYRRISVHEHPECTAEILDTSFFKMACRICGKEEYYTGPLVYVDEEQKLMIAMGEDAASEQEIENYLSFGYTVRKVDEIVELCEKILIHQDHLDDRIVELMKAADTVLLKDQEYDQMLYAPDEDAVYFELIKDAASAGRIPFLNAMYDDMKERFAFDLQDADADETVIDLHWASEFFEAHYHPAV